MADADPTRFSSEDARLDRAARAASVSGWPARARHMAGSGISRGWAGWRRQPIWVKLVAGFLALLALIWGALYVTKGRFLKHMFERMASSSLQREVTVGGDFNLYFNPISLRFKAEQMRIANPKWASKPYFFMSDLIDTRISTGSLIFGAERRIKNLLLQNGAIDLEWSPDGKANSWTFGDPTKPAQPLDIPAIRSALVHGTTLRYRDPKMQLLADLSIDTVRAQDDRFANDIRFSGGGALRGKPFTLRGGLMSPNETVAGGKNQLALRAEAASTVVEVTGTLPGPTVVEGADLRTMMRGPNLSLLFDYLGIAIPDTRNYRLTSNLTKSGDEWRFTRLRGRFGASDLAGRMTIAMPADRLKLSAVLATTRLDMIDVGPFVGYDPEKLDASGSAAVVRTVNGTPRILPDAPLRVDAIKNFDADVKYSVRTVTNQNVPISNIDLTLALERGLLKLSPLTFDMSGGHVASDISIDANRVPVFTRYDIRLSPTPMGKLLGRWGVEEAGTTGTLKARIQMTGLGDSVAKSLASSNGRIAVIIPAGTMWARNVQLSELDIGTFLTKMFAKKLKEPVQINCGLVAFTVRDGIAAADPILIDTKKNVILGRGGFSFRNEAIDMRIRADGKTFSLFSGQSPVGVEGYFAAPKIDVISPQLIARGGAALGLGVAASPLAAVLAFVDVGDAKAAACGPVLAGATAAAQRTAKGKPRDDVGRGTTAKNESGKASTEGTAKQKKKFLGIF